MNMILYLQKLKQQTNKEADFALVRRAKKGDYRAFDLLVLKYQSRIVSIAFKFVKEIQLAEDISQESFIKSLSSAILILKVPNTALTKSSFPALKNIISPLEALTLFSIS